MTETPKLHTNRRLHTQIFVVGLLLIIIFCKPMMAYRNFWVCNLRLVCSLGVSVINVLGLGCVF